MTTKQKLRHLAADFRIWRAEHFTKEQIEDSSTNDTGYPEWNDVEDCFASLIHDDQFG